MAEKKINDYTIGDTQDPTIAESYLPVDEAFMVDETVSASDEHVQALEKVFGPSETGSKDNALEVLRMAEADANISAAMLPMTDASDAVLKAQSFMDQSDYFRANAPLNDFEDRIVIRSCEIHAIAARGETD
jgi:YfdX protein